MKLNKFLFTFIMCGVIFMSSTNAFSDLPKEHWAYDKVMLMQSKGIISGFEDGTFRPNKPVTREQFATILVNTLELKNPWEITKFEDVEDDRWSKEAIDIASYYLDGVEINGKNYFNPAEPIIREDVAEAVVNTIDLFNSYRETLGILDKFSDKELISKKGSVSLAVNYGLMTGNSDGTFNPLGTLTRAELVALMCNLMPDILCSNTVELKNGEVVKVVIKDKEPYLGGEYIEIFSSDDRILYTSDIPCCLGYYIDRFRLLVDDFNGDGNPDFVVPNYLENRMDWFSEMYTILENGKVELLLRLDNVDLFSLEKIDDKTFVVFNNNYGYEYYTYDEKNQFYKLDPVKDIIAKIDEKDSEEYKTLGTLKPARIVEDVFNTYDEMEDFYYYDGYGSYDNIDPIYWVDVGDSIAGGTIAEFIATSVFDKEKKDYSASNLGNSYTENCWAEGVDGDGIGEKIEVTAISWCEKIDWNFWGEDKRDKSEIEKTGEGSVGWLLHGGDGGSANPEVNLDTISDYYQNLTQINIINGYAQNETLWKNNNRVKKMKLVIDNKEEYILELEDSDKFQVFELDYKNSNVGKPIVATFEILEVYKGDKYDDTVLTTLELVVSDNIRWGGR